MQVVRAGTCTINMTFKAATPADNLQTLYICCLRPTILKIDKDRKISTSFTLN